MLVAAPAQAQTGNSSAFGVQATGSVTALNAAILATLALGPLPTVSGSAPPAYNVSDSAASAAGDLSLVAPIVFNVATVNTGLLQVNAQSPLAPDPTATSTVNNLAFGLSVIPVAVPASALALAATSVQSSADIGGTCGGALTPVGSTTIVNGTLNGLIRTVLGLSGTITANPAPNTVLLDVTAVAGVLTSGRIRVLLNEQIVSGDGTTNLSLIVNAIHITVSGAVLQGVTGTVDLDVVIAQSRAALNCPGAQPQANLSIVKTDSPDPVNVPGTLTYQITVTNSGSANVPQARVTDNLPLTPSVTFGSATPSQGSCGAPNPLVCDLGVLNAGASASVTVNLNVQAGASGPIINTATVADASGVTTDPNVSDNSSTTSTAVNGPPSGTSADLSIVKTGTPNPVTAGQTLTYLLTITNHGPDAATNVVVTDPVPPGAGLQSATPSAGGNCTTGAVVTCTFPNLAANATATVTILATAPSQPGTVTNTAVVSSNVADPDPLNNSATTNTTVNGAPPGTADLSITKLATPNPVAAGQTLTYSITATNNGPDVATNVTITDPVPSGATLQSATPSAGGNCTTGSVVTCTFPSLAPSASASVTILVTAPSLPGTLTNTATVSSSVADPNPSNNTSTTNTTVSGGVAGAADLSITKVASPNPVTAGQPLTYSITAMNNGPTAAINVTITDPVPSGATLQSATPSAGGSCTTGGVVTCTFPSLAPSASASVTIVVTAPSQPGTVTNTASVSSSVSDPNPTNNSSTTTTTVNAAPAAAADLSITKVASPNPVTAGQSLTYFIATTNNGPNTATNVVITDPVPSGATLQSATPSAGGNCTTGGVVTCTFPSLAPSASASVTIVVTAPSQPGTVTNTASVSSSVSDPDLANNSSTTNTTVNAASAGAADLSIAKVASPNPVAPGQTLTYSITATNNGPNAATGVVITDPVPSGATLQSATPSAGGSCTTGAVVTCTFPSLAPNATVSVAIVVTAPSQPGTLTNSASVSSNVSDPNPSNNNATVGTQVGGGSGGADLAITKTASPNSVAPGGTLTYLLTVTNNGPGAATNLVVSDPLPAGVVLQSVTPSAGGSCGSANPVVCNFPVLGAGANVKVTIVVTVSAQGGSLTNTASVSSDVSDPISSNNSAAQTTPVVPGGGAGAANLGITKSASPNPVGPGAHLTYLLTVTNLGPGSATNVIVSDQLPPGVSLVSVTQSAGGNCTTGATVTCTFPSLANQASATVTIVVTTPTQPGTLTNTAAVSSATTDPDTSDNTVSLATQVTAVSGAEPIPTLSEWALIVFVGLLVGFGWYEAQRRRRSRKGPASA
ncbi:MAG TPA: IPTL-CTERM sorting domain-containing protein [Candidatus Acidoferrum sp.]|nr:IPTL-CTERM sorting domain-containing protein [Candidatus Acidoferrum sp.]